MRTLNVSLDRNPYPIHIGRGLLDQPGLVGPHLAGRTAAVVTNETVAPLYLDRMRATLEAAGARVIEIVLPDGERFKTSETLELIYEALLSGRAERSTTVVALGGGVVGDMAGYAAATYLRGVPFIQVPTTLLAQVDSSVGGKTGINHRLGKNMIGAFYQPRLVLIDNATLDTLPPREFSAGLAEVIKYGLIGDPDFFPWLEQNMDALLALDSEALDYAVHRSCADKARVVAADERETGERALLNLGHTFGHAIETGLGYGEWLHGEAVAAGTMVAADVSLRMGWLAAAEVDRIRRLFERARLPVKAPALGVDRYLELMAGDKKVAEGRIRFVLPKGLGQSVLTADVPQEILRAALAL